MIAVTSLNMSRIFLNSSDKISQTTVLRVEPPWDNNSAPALIKTKDFIEIKQEPIIRRTDETKTSTNKACHHSNCDDYNGINMQQFNLQIYPQVDATKPEFQQTKSLDFETKGKRHFFFYFLCCCCVLFSFSTANCFVVIISIVVLNIS